jgi:glycosyltransferase involved in cell wall biosynthesis
VGQRWAKRNGIKHVCLLMGQDAKKENQYLKRIKPKSENLVSISDFNAEELFMNHGIKPAQVIPLGIEPEIFSSQHFKRDIDILCAGSLIPLKQFDMAIEVAKELTRTHSLLRMVICGTGPEEKKLHSLIKENKLEGNVKLIGEKKYAETIQLMEISRLFLHPSNYEGFSGVCIEARGAGTPVVSFIKPMNEDIPGWHIVNSRDEMIKECGRILQSNADPQPVFPFTSDDASKRFIDLFR